MNNKKQPIQTDLKLLGITSIEETNKKENTIADLISKPPLMVLVECLSPATVWVNKIMSRVNKGEILCMHYNTYAKYCLNEKTKQKMMKPYKKPFKYFFKRYKGNNLDHKNLLIWRMGGIGDIMFSQPICKYLKQTYPTCTITYATAPHIISLINCWPKGLIDRTISIPFRKEELLKSDYHLTFEGAIERCHEASRENCYDIFRMVSGLIFNPSEYPIELIPKQYLIDKYRSIVPEKTISVQMRSSSRIRAMPSYIWRDIIKSLIEKGYNIGIMDEKSYDFVYETFKKEYNLQDIISFSKYSNSLEDGIAIMSLCIGSINIDSSFTHISAALNKPTIGIYGPFLGELRMKYYKTADWINSENYKECGQYPCFYHESELHNCPFARNLKPPGCLSSINPDLVVEKFLNLLERENEKRT